MCEVTPEFGRPPFVTGFEKISNVFLGFLGRKPPESNMEFQY